jgi:AsmA protein
LIRNNTVAMLLTRDVLDQMFVALNPLAEQDEYSVLDCVVLQANVEDGIADLSPILAQGKKVVTIGRGTIDLNTERLDILYNAKPRSGIGLSADMFVTPFTKLSGSLANPRLGFSAEGTLLSGGAAVMTGGSSLLLEGLFDRVTAVGDRCEKAFVAVGRPWAAASPP